MNSQGSVGNQCCDAGDPTFLGFRQKSVRRLIPLQQVPGADKDLESREEILQTSFVFVVIFVQIAVGWQLPGPPTCHSWVGANKQVDILVPWALGLGAAPQLHICMHGRMQTCL